MNSSSTTQNAWSPEDCDRATAALHNADALRILVVGDLMVDAYLLGRVDRISPEAPVPILRASHRERRPGGAANVALNLKALGASVTVGGAIGMDQDGQDLQKELKKQGLLMLFSGCKGPVRDVMQRADFFAACGRQRFFPYLDDAVNYGAKLHLLLRAGGFQSQYGGFEMSYKRIRDLRKNNTLKHPFSGCILFAYTNLIR